MLHLSRSLPALMGASVLLPSWLLLSACGPDWSPPGPQRTETRSVDLDNSEEVRAELRMGAGELRVRGGAAKLMEARFMYNRLRLRPEVTYHNAAGGFRGHLLVEEPSGVHGSSNRYEWDLAFNDNKPLDLEVKCGAGESHLDLGDLSLRRVEVEMGVGELRMDLRGMPKNDYSVFIRGGVGEATVYLPGSGAGVGIEAEARGGIGGVQTTGLEKRDGRYVNDALGHAKTTVRLDIRGGIGSIRLIAE
jgi:N-terminal domain of toast_rack, DUF2154